MVKVAKGLFSVYFIVRFATLFPKILQVSLYYNKLKNNVFVVLRVTFSVISRTDKINV